jgi:hypothetical protein
MDNTLAKVLFTLLLATSMFTSGCISTTSTDYRYEVEDSAKSSNTDGTTDVLFTMTLVSGEQAMAISDLLVTINPHEEGTVKCRIDSTTDCTLTQSGTDAEVWEIGENISVVEAGLDICKATCIIDFSVTGPKDTKTVGPTILHIS